MDRGRLSSLLSLNEHVVLDGYQTWPTGVRAYLDENEAELKGFIATEREIDKAAQERAELRWDRPKNEFQDAWELGKDQVRAYLDRRRFVGFHCTRLTDLELAEVSQNGLTPISESLLEKRLRQVERSGELPPEIANKIRQRNDVLEPVRNGRISVFHCLHGLRDGGGLNRLLRAWGGEAVYRRYERDLTVFSALRRIGKPCIVVLSINYEDIFSAPSAEERLIRIYVARNDEWFQRGDTDSFIARGLPVLDLVAYDEPRFNTLTAFDQWDEEIA